MQKERHFLRQSVRGVREFKAIAVVGGKHGVIQDYCTPCGVCRQVMMEFCMPEDFQIIAAKSREDYRVYTLAELFPQAFSQKSLEEAEM